jgi:SAM-dependent methyltransferase
MRQSLALANYLHLDLLDRARDAFQWTPDSGANLVDVGSQHFYYASVLHAFFQPQKLTGVEIEGYRICQDGYSRFDYAMTYIRDLPNTQYQVIDFCDFTEAADGITCFYPFVEPVALVRWRLPLKVFRPELLAQTMARVLRPKGFVFMVNCGEEEGVNACRLVVGADLKLVGQLICPDPLTEWKEFPVISLWEKG